MTDDRDRSLLTVNRNMFFQRLRGIFVRVLLAIISVLLIGEGWLAFRTSYALFRIDVVDFHQAPLNSDIYTEAIKGLLLLTAAYLCLMRRTDFLERCLVPAVLLIPYGLWTIYTFRKTMLLAYRFGETLITLRWALEGDYAVQGFLSGVGYVAIGVLALIAHALNRHRGYGTYANSD